MPQPGPNTFDLGSVFFGALLAMLLSYFLWRLQQWVQRRERRKNLATAMLVELWSLDWTLRSIFTDNEAALSYGSLPSYLFADAPRTALEFPPESLFRVMLFRGLCLDLDMVRERARTEFKEANETPTNDAVRLCAQKNHRRHHYVRAKAGFALSLIPELVTDLTNMGGVWRDPGSVRTTDGHALPEIPLSPFGHKPDDPG